MLLESVSSTVKRAEELLNSINNNLIGSDSHIRVEDHFTGLSLKTPGYILVSGAINLSFYLFCFYH